MAYATTYEYFINKISIPNLSAGRPDRTLIDSLIQQYEFDYLVQLFGYEIAVLVQDEIDNSTGNTPYAEIVNGTTYVDVNGVTKVWKGLSNTSFMSPVANYIYCQYLRLKEISNTGIGMVRQNAENAILADGSLSFSRAWADMVDMNWNVHNYLVSYKGTDTAFDDDYIGFKYYPVTRSTTIELEPNQLLFVNANHMGL